MPKYARGKLPRLVDERVPTIDHPHVRCLMGATALSSPATWKAMVKAWFMLGNDDYGDCAWAAIAHAILLWTTVTGQPIIPTTEAALDNYSNETGFRVGPPAANDNGTILLAALKFWMITGVAVNDNAALDKLDGFAAIEPDDIESLKKSIDTFGCALLGVELPDSAETEFDAGQPWADTSGDPTGGHCVLAVDYDAGGMWVVTWGHLQYLTWAWWRRYGSEAYALLRREWIACTGLSPSGQTMAQLDAAILRLRGTLGLGA